MYPAKITTCMGETVHCAPTGGISAYTGDRIAKLCYIIAVEMINNE
jgi:hypothetical protein